MGIGGRFLSHGQCIESVNQWPKWRTDIDDVGWDDEVSVIEALQIFALDQGYHLVIILPK